MDTATKLTPASVLPNHLNTDSSRKNIYIIFIEFDSAQTSTIISFLRNNDFAPRGKNIETMQQRFESSLDDVMQEQQQHMHKVFSNIDAGLKEQVSKTGEVVEKQLGMIDQSMQQEINRTMNEMGKALGQISNQFVNDYSRLVSKMDTVLKQAV